MMGGELGHNEIQRTACGVGVVQEASLFRQGDRWIGCCVGETDTDLTLLL